MLNAAEAPTPRALISYYTEAIKDRPLRHGFGLIEDDIHALIERTALQVVVDHAPQTDS
jgi:hypothetical protein